MPRKVTKEKNKPDQEQLPKKEVALPLNAEEQAKIEKWKLGETQNQVPFKFEVEITPNATNYHTNTLTERGSVADRQNLIDAAFCEATGAKNSMLAKRLFITFTSATGLVNRDKPDEIVVNTNAVLDALYAMKPQDEVEGMLITRLISLHFQSMNYLAISSNNNLSPQGRDTNINRSTKLFRLYNETLEALMRYRRKGEQKVLVQHVNVGQGGQAAFVGEIHNGGGGLNKN